MKRSPPSYTSSTSSSDIDTDSDFSPCFEFEQEQDTKPIVSSPPTSARSTPKKPKTNNQKSPSTSPKKPRIKSEPNTNGVWDGEKRALFIDEIIALGYRHANLDELASKLGMNKRQLVDQLVPNKSNLRKKMVMAAKSM
ncbi:hypothetical protein I302_104101 [Kwoniella bestiolae CBS 10118]|uniref:Uncharacterized protein n=1 Tax=Kwoniella bestiolae CBS 10118 TaxID=1296100 RepID=A0A1B9GAA6_9TREE|nr:hypothetical protein I302_02809 [Kwoniella bestiolae CBS 10118]OCF27959.1 hypothetical protein I302_02809 [Kwoniella bestiolae CBS 10118]